MAKLIGSRGVSDNWGENLYISHILEYLDDNCIVYWNREVFGREFDVCILLPQVGILIVELKAWKEQSILRVENSDTIVIATDEGDVSVRPQKQVRGYRFAIERHIRQSIGESPLVFTMVCFPQISTAFYREHRLDVVTEESFTILKEDLQTKSAFFEKLNRAISHATSWTRTSFDATAMLKIRNLFETELELDGDGELNDISSEPSVFVYQSEYSMFYYISADSTSVEETICDLADHYKNGCKIYAIFGTRQQLCAAAHAIDNVLSAHGLIRNRDNLEIVFSRDTQHYPPIDSQNISFVTFNCAMSVLCAPSVLESIPDSFCIYSGKVEDKQQLDWLRFFDSNSDFNIEQYLVEHADPNKNIVIRAGAGTGKTYTMISRIGYICYSQNIPISTMADRIVMITFTNEAASQMGEKLKNYFRNCYLISTKTDYLTMISRIDNMQISTIHSYAKNLIAKLGTEFGYGIDLGITSSQYFRRRKVSDIIDTYIREKRRKIGQSYLERLGMPMYLLRDTILDFINKLQNKSVDVASIQPADWGSIEPTQRCELHELLATVIPQVESEYTNELMEENRIHLSAMMSVLSHFISNVDSEKRIKELQKGKPQFMFVDEFQDTDDTQIEMLLQLARILEYRLFLVGDIKQCIYRFRGAKEKAFDQLHIDKKPDEWLEFSLQKNYRTDSMLLELYDLSFSAWGARSDELLAYSAEIDRLIGTRSYNNALQAKKDKFYKCITINKDEMRIPELIEEIKRLQTRLKYDEERGLKLSQNEKSIAILVRENWQADIVRTEAAKIGISVQTNTGGDLYMSTPALEMMTLVNALLHFDEVNYLFNLVTTNFFALDIPKSNLFEMRLKNKREGWLSRADEKSQTNYLIDIMNRLLVGTVKENNTWELIIKGIRTKPVLQTLREIYATLKPWINFSSDPWKQHYYRMNVDLLFEQLINACNIDGLSINTLQEYLYNSIASSQSVDSRTPPTDDTSAPLQCITVHKAKGLEYGHVILPFCSTPIDQIKKTQLHISTEKIDGRTRVGYCINLVDEEPATNEYYNESVEKAEKSREETRILYVAMTRAIRSFSWITIENRGSLSWQSLIQKEEPNHAL